MDAGGVDGGMGTGCCRRRREVALAAGDDVDGSRDREVDTYIFNLMDSNTNPKQSKPMCISACKPMMMQ
jgi:hypothetical protein